MIHSFLHSNADMNRSLPFNLGLAFLVGFLFIFFCFVGLPVDFNADHLEGIQSVNSLSYVDLVRLILNPLTPAWFFPPDTNWMGYLRPLQYLIIKAYFDWFGYGLVPFHLTVAVGLGLLNVLFFVLIFYATQSLLYAWLGAILYASFPSNFFLHASIFSMDLIYYVSILSILALALFGFLTFGMWKKKLHFLVALFGFVLTIWLVIKLKSTEKILPFVCLGFLLMRFKFILSRIGRFRLALLFSSLLAMWLMVIPLKPFEYWLENLPHQGRPVSFEPTTQKDRVTFSFSWKNLIQRTFYVPGGEFPFLIPHRREIPRSFTENLGFFLGWLFWLGVLLIPFILTRSKEKNGDAYRHGLGLVLVWFTATILGFSNGQPVLNTRFLNFGYVPSVLLFLGSVGWLEQRFFSEARRRLFLRGILSLLVIYTTITNFGFFAMLLGHFGGIQDALVRAEKDVFRSFYGEESDDRTLYERHLELENRAVIIDWYDLPADWFEMAEGKLRREKKLYFYARGPESEKLKRFVDGGYAVTLWKSYSFFDAKPLFFKATKAIDWAKSLYKKRKKREILIYLIEERPPT